MIIETSDNRFYIVRETGNPDLAHVWIGDEVRRRNGGWEKRKNRKGEVRPQLIRKAASRIVEA